VSLVFTKRHCRLRFFHVYAHSCHVTGWSMCVVVVHASWYTSHRADTRTSGQESSQGPYRIAYPLHASTFVTCTRGP
jgi:hypothetical protein